MGGNAWEPLLLWSQAWKVVPEVALDALVERQMRHKMK